MTRVRTWAAAFAAVVALVIAGLAALVTPTLGASPASQDQQASLIRLGDAGARGVTTVGDPEVRARFGPKPNVMLSRSWRPTRAYRPASGSEDLAQ